MVDVRVNTSRPAYVTEKYKGTKAKPGGILIKIRLRRLKRLIEEEDS
jgi:hypothetical protein